LDTFGMQVVHVQRQLDSRKELIVIQSQYFQCVLLTNTQAFFSVL